LLHRLLCCPLGPGTQCDPTHCAHPCVGVPGPAYGPGFAPGCGAACEPCSPAACEPCGPTACEAACVEPCGPVIEAGCGPAFGPYYAGGSPYHDGPGCGYCCRGLLGGVLRIFCPPCWCGKGCGEIYWSEFHSDPPDCCDPCDRHGNFTGVGCVSSASCDAAACEPCGPSACGPPTCDPPAPILPAREYVSRLRAPVESSEVVRRAARPPQAEQR